MQTGRPIARVLGLLMLALGFLPWSSALAQGPHEIVLIINRNSAASLEIAHHYAQLRRVPPSNLIYLDLPEHTRGTRAEFTPAEFTTLIRDPVQRAIDERRLNDHILAWIYSADFPVRIMSEPPVSLAGATFVRGTLPTPEEVDKGRYASPLFRGPDRPEDKGAPAGSIQEFAILLRERMPVPSMMLGHTGARGLPVETVVDQLRRAASADGTRPRDPFHFHTSDDVRSTCRRWQFEGAAAELKEIGMAALISSNRPSDALAVSGIMLGGALVPEPWGRLQPGAIADNLTSLGAVFHTHEQTRLSQWIARGAAASAGTIWEPYANWAKFPHARLFAHYARGCTLLESYMQAVRSPMQLQVVGDPLCRPWSPAPSLMLINIEDDGKPLRGIASFMASSFVPTPGLTYLFMLNGRSLPAGGATAGLKIDTSILRDGYHELHAVAYTPGPIRRQGHARLGIHVDNRGQSATLALAAGASAEPRLHQPLNVLVSASAGATNLRIAAFERVLWQGPATTQAQAVALAPREIGPGPVSLQATAQFADGGDVRSEPLAVTIRSDNQPPARPAIATTSAADGKTRLIARSDDPDGDAVRITWFADLRAVGFTGNSLAPDGTLASTGGSLVVKSAATTEQPAELAATLRTAEVGYDSGWQLGGLVFDLKDELNYACFGWNWKEGGWMLGRVENGRLVPHASRGMPLDPRRDYEISVRQEGDRVTAWVDGEQVGASTSLVLRGPFGLCGGQPALTLSRLALSPPPGWAAPQATNTMAVLPDGARPPLLIRATDTPGASAWTELR
jgi:hypothetical protein